ncbi:MAG: GTPase HflX [Bryobacterales bacterium]|nr:GTPase HflX [Bryobacteraceae bacterium]MDW8355991.1 GTPase HflX [Bryobacterales bacterium]
MRERAILVGLELTGGGYRGRSSEAEELLEELASLAESAGAEVIHQTLQTRAAPEAATLIGSGKVEEIAGLVQAGGADVVIFDRDLSPTQQRNLERAFGCKVIDRTQLILDIFATRARTREGQLQVELAQLNYLLPRLAGRGKEMSRLGGGIGTRGPGETQLETDRRRIYRRIRKIREELESVRLHRSVQRRQRQSVPLATAALVGYTNAGKSTLFNRLTGAGVLADDRLFATLDPTIRQLVLPSRRRVLLSDTVGFIRKLPPTLVEAFRATLEEVTEASLLVHVVDASSPLAPRQAVEVRRVLADIGAGRTPQLLVLNKTDRIFGEAAALNTLAQRIAGESASGPTSRWVAISALTGEGVDRLLEAIDEMLPLDPVSAARFRIPATDGAALHVLHEFGRVSAMRYCDGCCEAEAEVPESVKRRLAAYLLE